MKRAFLPLDFENAGAYCRAVLESHRFWYWRSLRWQVRVSEDALARYRDWEKDQRRAHHQIEQQLDEGRTAILSTLASAPSDESPELAVDYAGTVANEYGTYSPRYYLGQLSTNPFLPELLGRPDEPELPWWIKSVHKNPFSYITTVVFHDGQRVDISMTDLMETGGDLPRIIAENARAMGVLDGYST